MISASKALQLFQQAGKTALNHAKLEWVPMTVCSYPALLAINLPTLVAEVTTVVAIPDQNFSRTMVGEAVDSKMRRGARVRFGVGCGTVQVLCTLYGGLRYWYTVSRRTRGKNHRHYSRKP